MDTKHNTVKEWNFDLSWAYTDISRKLKQYTNNEYILVFPFCSKKHLNKKWPYFKDLILKIKNHYKNKYSLLIVPGPGEIEEAKKFNIKVILEDGKSTSLNNLITYISKAKFIISNDTGPAHICSHLNKPGIVLFGSHTSPEKVSIETKNFVAIKSENLSNLSADVVMKKIINSLN